MTEPEVTEAIKEFLADPLSSNGGAAIILKFAEESPDREVTIAQKFLPWLEAEQDQKNGHLWLAAFIAGNLQE